jgi:hypothetical protein
MAYRKLAVAEDLYTAWAAKRQPAPAGCRVVAHRKLAGADDLDTARATFTLHRPPTGGRLRLAAG